MIHVLASADGTAFRRFQFPGAARGACASALLLSLIFPASGHSEGSNLSRATCAPIPNSSDSLCLFRDRSLDASGVDSLWGTVESSGYARSELRRLSPSGKILASRPLDPLSKLDSTRIGSSVWFLATEDLSCGFGSYAGPTIHVLDLSDPHRIPDAHDQKGEGIVLVQTLKTVWKQVADGYLIAACRPRFDSTRPDGASFSISYERLRLQNGRWIRSHRKAPGFSEFEDGFPDLKLFPR